MSILVRTCLALFLACAATPGFAKTQDATGCEAVLPKGVMATHTLPPYPRISIRLGESGATMVAVTIGPNGAPISTTVSSSSGSERLDAAAMAHIMQVWRWEPLPETCRQSVTTLVRVVWDLKEAPPEEKPGFGDLSAANIMALTRVLVMDAADIPPGVIVDRPIFSLMLVIVPEAGDPTIAMTRPSGNAALDARAQELVRTRYRWMPARMDGKATGSGAIIAMFWMPPGTPKMDPDALKTLMGAFVNVPQKPAP